MDIWPTLETSLEIYKEETMNIKNCLRYLEKQCRELIKEISSQSYRDTQNNFDKLLELQTYLAKAALYYDFPISDDLYQLVKEFDRLDDEFIRKYWYEKFREGVIWPIE